MFKTWVNVVPRSWEERKVFLIEEAKQIYEHLTLCELGLNTIRLLHFLILKKDITGGIKNENRAKKE